MNDETRKTESGSANGCPLGGAPYLRSMIDVEPFPALWQARNDL